LAEVESSFRPSYSLSHIRSTTGIPSHSSGPDETQSSLRFIHSANHGSQLSKNEWSHNTIFTPTVLG
jgi:hypothetical protein